MTIDRQQFVNPEAEDWWLVQTDADSTIVDKRLQVGTLLGVGDREWFTQETNLLKLWTLLESENQDLLRTLEEATDALKRADWLDSVIGAITPDTDAGTPGPAPSTVASEAPTAKTEVAPTVVPKPSIFAKKPIGDSPSAPPSTQTSSAAPTAPPAPAQAPAEEPATHITEAVEDKVHDLEAAVADPAIEIDQKELSELLADPAAQAEFAKYLEEFEEAAEKEAEEMIQEAGA